MFENYKKILILPSKASYVNFLKNLVKCFLVPWKFFSILRFYSIKRIGKNLEEFSRGKKASSKVSKLPSARNEKSKNFQTQWWGRQVRKPKRPSNELTSASALSSTGENMGSLAALLVVYYYWPPPPPSSCFTSFFKRRSPLCPREWSRGESKVIAYHPDSSVRTSTRTLTFQHYNSSSLLLSSPVDKLPHKVLSYQHCRRRDN